MLPAVEFVHVEQCRGWRCTGQGTVLNRAQSRQRILEIIDVNRVGDHLSTMSVSRSSPSTKSPSGGADGVAAATAVSENLGILCIDTQ
jgi:hypothetical protein